MPRAGRGHRHAGAMLVRALDDVARLVLPVACPGCDRPDVRWCATCLGLLRAPLRRREDGAPRLDRLDGAGPLPVWAPAAYAGPVRGVVVAWKDRARADLDRPLAAVGRAAGVALGPVLAAAARAAPAVRAAPGAVRTDLVVVPAPTAPAARRARGRDPVAVLARSVAAGLRAAGVRARVVPLVRQRGRARDQVGLGSRARGARLRGVDVARRPGRVRDALRDRTPCLLVDDVLTTGATLAACESALAGAGVPVLGAFVLAATPAPGERRGPRRVPSSGPRGGRDRGPSARAPLVLPGTRGGG